MVKEVLLPDGRLETRVYDEGRLISVTRSAFPPGSTENRRPLRSVYSHRIA